MSNDLIYKIKYQEYTDWVSLITVIFHRSHKKNLPECTYANDCTVVDFEEKDWFKITV